MSRLALGRNLLEWAQEIMGVGEHFYSSLLVDQDGTTAVLFQRRFAENRIDGTSIDVTVDRHIGRFNIVTLQDLSLFLRPEKKRIFYVLGETVFAGIVDTIKHNGQYNTYELEGECVAIAKRGNE